MNKKVGIIILVLMVLVFLVGCVDYKAYDLPEKDDGVVNDNLLDEIAAIEEELNIEGDAEEVEGEVVLDGETTAEETEESVGVEEEVVLPELTEEPVANEEFTGLDIINVKENEPVKLNLVVSDPDDDPVTYTFSQPLNKDGEWKTNYGDAGEYIVTITATDGKLSTEKKVKIVVERVNVPPTVEAVRDLVVNEGEEVKFSPRVSDPNGDEVTVTVSEPLREGSFDTDHTSSGEYMIKVFASDGELETEKTFKLTVRDVNVLPELSNLDDITVSEGETVRIEPRVSDLDEDDIVLTISEPVGNDGVWETSFTDHGEYVVTVTANDGKDRVVEKVSVTVRDINMPPEITDVFLSS